MDTEQQRLAGLFSGHVIANGICHLVQGKLLPHNL